MIAMGTTLSSSSVRYANDSSRSRSALDCSILPMRCSSRASMARLTRRLVSVRPTSSAANSEYTAGRHATERTLRAECSEAMTVDGSPRSN